MARSGIAASTIAVWTAIVLFGLGGAAAVLIWSGVYNVAASRGHFPITAWLLEAAMRQSVKAHSSYVRSPPLENPDMVRLGAAHYKGGCAPCHGAPGEPKNPIVQRLLPPPSDLPEVVNAWSAEQLYWIVKNGIKYTAMPAWAAPERDDEVWMLVAFLRRLPQIGAREYLSLANGNATQIDRKPREIAHFGSDAAAISACARCHEDEAAPPQSQLAPKLASQSAQYLALALEDYSSGLRLSGIMQPVAAELDREEMQRLSSYYANLAIQKPPQYRAPEPDRLERGRAIATAGIPRSGVPPCLSCHGGNGIPTYPKLAGQYRAYIIGQLNLFQKGLRNKTPQAVIMTTIAERLTISQIEDVAEFLEHLERGTDPAPAGALP
jgi:cytochrome c553